MPLPARPTSLPRAMTLTTRPPQAVSGWSLPSAVDARSALEFLVPPFFQCDVVLVHVVVIEIDEFLDFLGREANALVEVWRDGGVGDGRVVTHVDRKGLLCALFQHCI